MNNSYYGDINVHCRLFPASERGKRTRRKMKTKLTWRNLQYRTKKINSLPIESAFPSTPSRGQALQIIH